MSEDQYRLRADDLLRQASEASNMRDRGRLIDEALHWHRLATQAHDERREQRGGEGARA